MNKKNGVYWIRGKRKGRKNWDKRSHPGKTPTRYTSVVRWQHEHPTSFVPDAWIETYVAQNMWQSECITWSIHIIQCSHYKRIESWILINLHNCKKII